MQKQYVTKSVVLAGLIAIGALMPSTTGGLGEGRIDLADSLFVAPVKVIELEALG